MASRQLTLEEVFALPEPAIQAYLQSKSRPSQGFWFDRISTIIHYGDDGWLTDDDREMVRHMDFLANAQLTEEEIIQELQDQGVDVTALMTRFDLIRQLLLEEDDIAGYPFAFGRNDNGQLGLGDRDARNTPIQVEGIPGKVKAVSAGGFHTMAITKDGQLFAFGYNTSGQLGLNDESRGLTPTPVIVLTPTPVPIPGKIKAVSTGYEYTMVITEDGQLFAFGWNMYSQLGLGDYNNRNIPTPVPIPGKVKAVSAGGNHTMAITENGQLLAFGLNELGQLGLGDNNPRGTPTQVPIPGRVKAVSAGGTHTMIINEDDQLFAFGDNRQGQLGLGDNNNRNTPTLVERISRNIKAVSAGGAHTMVITEDDQLRAFGDNQRGQLGLTQHLAINVPLPVRIPEKVLAVSAGEEHTMVVIKGDHLLAFGANSVGQLGLRDNRDRALPATVSILAKIKAVSAGNRHTMIIAVG